ncbi:hypothetical protein [Frigoribacterium sp. UYMn621]|uniref:hypothetical protein n=1 Tax=Frigoribacterium sp. UYMn621 TaxID=3156343 RepID=UPI003392FF98
MRLRTSNQRAPIPGEPREQRQPQMSDSSTTLVDTELADARTILISADRQGDAVPRSKLLIVAGLENWQAAESAGSAAILTVGLQRASEWHGVNGAPHEDLSRMVRPDGTTEATIQFTRVETDIATYDAAVALGSYLTRVGAKTVSFAKIGVATLELDLETLGDDPKKKSEYLDRLVANAGTIGRRPAAPKTSAASSRQSIAPIVDLEAGQIYLERLEGREVLMEAAARRLRTVTVYDDLRDPGARKALHLHDLEITVNTSAGLRTYEVQGVRDADLASPRRWLNRIPGGTSIAVATGAHVLRAIESAVRAHEYDLVVESVALRRTGWKEINGRWGYLSASGFMTADGLTDDAVSELSERMRNIRYPDTVDRSREVEAAKNTMAAFEELTDPNLFIGPWGAIIHNVAGLGNGGAGCVVAIQGSKGSGKTTVVSFLAAHAGSSFSSDLPMATIDGSASNLGRLGAGLESSFICVDDARKRTSLKKAENEAEGIERLLRMGYAGGAARYTVSEFDQETQTWTEGLPDLASPLVILSGETLPAGDENGASSRERIYPVQIPKGAEIFESGNARRFVQFTENGLPEQHLAHFIRWCAESIEDFGGMEAWRSFWKEAEQGFVDRKAKLPVSIRVREVASVPHTGFVIWLRYLLEIGVIDRDEFFFAGKLALITVDKTALDHGTLNVPMTTAAEFESILATLRSSIVGRQGYVRYLQSPFDESAGDPTRVEREQQLESDQGRFGARLVGVQKQGRSTKGGEAELFLAMQPSDILSLLHREPRFKGLTESELLKAFEEVSIKDGLKLTKMVMIDGQRVKTVSIPWSVWTGTPDDAEAAA